MAEVAEPIEDVLVFEYSDAGFSLVGGRGRGAGWAGLVQLEPLDGSLVGRAWQVGRAVRVDHERPRHVAGPYHARHAVALPVGQRHVVVLGSREPIRLHDADLLRQAAAAVDGIAGVPADKLLADELEVVGAIRTLMAYRPLNVRDTARHVAEVTARALSCEVAAIRVQHGEQGILEGVSVGIDAAVPGPRAESLLRQAARHVHGPSVEQAATAGAELFGIDVASRMTLPLGGGHTVGVLAVGHSAERPRGFTSLCQRIGRAIAESADSLLAQAAAREELNAQVDLLARASDTDPLTGVANRRAWDAAAATLRGQPSVRAVVVSCDFEDLKLVNDRHGHAAGDAVLVASASLLSACVRQGDLVARLGGDEFGLLLRDADRPAGRRVLQRIRRAERRWRVPNQPIAIRLSVGMAEVCDGDVEGARAVADRRMYVNKRRRAPAAARSRERPPSDRRRA